jgi:cysteine synthase
MLANDVLHTIGNTPHIRINRLFGNGHSVYIKSERSNPGGSIKDRIAAAMVEAPRSPVRSGRAARSSNRPRATPASASRWWLP